MIGLPLFNAFLVAGRRRLGEEDCGGEYVLFLSGTENRRRRSVLSWLLKSLKMSSSKILRIVKKWQKAAKPQQPSSFSNLDADGDARRHRESWNGMQEEEEEEKPVPEGFVEIYVGREKRRYVISGEYLETEVFKRLIEKSKLEQGSDDKAGLCVACEVVLFEHLLWLLKSADEVGSWYGHDTDDLAELYAY